jgi:16S rRNA (guanine(527)-N(7))-methyltransferase RsmG
MSSDPPPTETSFDANDTLESALARHGIELSDDVRAKVQQYINLLWEWNEKINLTRHTTYDKFVGRDLRDTVEVARLLHPKEEVLDVGSGGGVPGLLLAVLRPDLTITLSDSVGKKTKVLESMVESLGLASVTVYNARSEELLEDFKYDALTIRAVGSLETMLRWFKPHWRHIGRLLILKARRIDARSALESRGRVSDAGHRFEQRNPQALASPSARKVIACFLGPAQSASRYPDFGSATSLPHFSPRSKQLRFCTVMRAISSIAVRVKNAWCAVTSTFGNVSKRVN